MDVGSPSGLGGTLTSWNGGAEYVCGYPKAEVLGHNVTVLTPPEDHDRQLARLADVLGAERREAVGLARNARRFPVFLTLSPIRDGRGRGRLDGGPRHHRARKAEEGLSYLASYDHLTGFADRTLFRDRLQGPSRDYRGSPEDRPVFCARHRHRRF